MARNSEQPPLAQPWIYLVRMVVFVVLGAFIAFILYRSIVQAFNANPPLNALILGVLAIGIVLGFRSVIRLFREVQWANAYFESETGLVMVREPVMLLPMAKIMEGRGRRRALPSAVQRAVLDSIGARLDETRDTGRYLTGLLVFLGLLGTFWGLLETVSSVGKVIQSMKAGADAALMFEDLKGGLAAPLGGMGISFSSSLFGLAGSLVLGFLDLQVGQAQNRFYEQVENSLAMLSRPAGGGISTSDEPDGVASATAISELASGVAALVETMRVEQQMIRDWVEAQAVREQELKTVLERVLVEKRRP